MKRNTPRRGLGKVVQIDEAQIKSHLGEMVRESVEETLNGLLDAEADERPFAEQNHATQTLILDRPDKTFSMAASCWRVIQLAMAATRTARGGAPLTFAGPSKVGGRSTAIGICVGAVELPGIRFG